MRPSVTTRSGGLTQQAIEDVMVSEVEGQVEPEEQDVDDDERQRGRQPIPDIRKEPVWPGLDGLYLVVITIQDDPP